MNKDSLLPIFSILEKFDISYVLIGGYAVAVWGAVRATRDVDFLADISRRTVPAIIEAFKESGYSVEYRPGDIGDPVWGVIRLRHELSENDETIEILSGIKKMPGDIYKRAETITLAGLNIPVASPEDLIVLKLLAGGPVDLDDARTIFKVMEERLDKEYLRKELLRCKLSVSIIS